MFSYDSTHVSTGMRDIDIRNEELVILLRSSLEPYCASHAPTIITNDMGNGGAVSDRLTNEVHRCKLSFCNNTAPFWHLVKLSRISNTVTICHTLLFQ